ncbi:hypothetical protein ACQEVI_26930 [Promicromonospora sp. CA-289599]|uniref:hypothetical protein n=1 Tax=Promicromonospora sp. CA-289599 TaxID=3240014 RepID=UPI003D915D48
MQWARGWPGDLEDYVANYGDPADEHNDGWGLHMLLAGDAHDAPELQKLLALMPRCAYGQVYVEVGATGGQTDVDPAGWDMPPGMSLTVLRRSPGSPRARRGRLDLAPVHLHRPDL